MRSPYPLDQVARQMGALTALEDMLGLLDPEAICVCGDLLSEHVGVRNNGGPWRSPCKGCRCDDFEDAPDCVCRDCLEGNSLQDKS